MPGPVSSRRLKERDLAEFQRLLDHPDKPEHSWARSTVRDLLHDLRVVQEALRKGQAFERCYQETLGASMTAAQWDRLDSLQSAFLDAYLVALSEPEVPQQP